MSQPEISKRCLSCGASVREHAMFCPECGQPLSQVGNLEKTVASGAGPVNPEPEAAPKETVASAALERPRTAKARETLHRASTVAKGALEDNVKRVEKIRQVSSVVLEEAHYDPSLRFVLVALGVFLVFVILLVLSKVMG